MSRFFAKVGCCVILLGIHLTACRTSDSGSRPKITGGDYVESKDYPSNLYISDLKCSAVAISPHVLITAGHCVTVMQNNFLTPIFITPELLLNKAYLYFGWSIAADAPKRSDTRRYLVKRVLIHPKWVKAINKAVEEYKQLMAEDSSLPFPVEGQILTDAADQDINDVALIEVGENLPVPAVPFATPDQIAKDLVYEQTGSGCDHASTNSLRVSSDYLMSTKKIVTDIQANRILISPRDLRDKAQACPGDSGGPVYFRDERGALTLVGVNSVVEYVEDETSIPGTYIARVDHLQQWIKDFVSKDGDKK